MPSANPLDPSLLQGNQLPAQAPVSSLLWRLNRLRCMSPAEITHRLRRRFGIQLEALGLLAATAIPQADLTQVSRPWISVPAGIDGEPYLAAADRLVAGKFDLLALHDIDLGPQPAWNRDPKSGIEAPPAFGKLLDYRNPQLVGDIKYLWELNRHQHLVTLAQAWAISGDAKYAQTIFRHLQSWIDSCPHGRGPNWSSALEAGLRLISWAVTWQLLGGTQAPIFQEAWAASLQQRWLDAIHRHAGFIESFFSLHSSANNHLIGEAAGLFVAAVTWPCWPQSARWRDQAKSILEREARLQNAPDGVNLEQATAYQQFEIDLLLLPLLAARANNLEFSADYSEIIEKMLAFLASIMDVGGHIPMFGDADDGVVVRLTPVDSRESRYRSSLATGAILFERSAFKSKAGQLDDKTRWLLGGDVDSRFAALPGIPVGQAGLPVRRAFPQGGYYILGSDLESADELRLVADAGPLGYQRIAAHGHADALSFTLSLGGREFLVDPGTYAYHTQGSWRQYFRGTAAHNTVRVDGQDQSRSGGNFMWLNKALAYCSHWHSTSSEDVFEGWHNGYRRLADPVTHQRRITLDKRSRRIIIEDRLLMREEHEIELFFHCSEDCKVVPASDGYLIDNGDRRILVYLPRVNNTGHPMYRGNFTPILGWISRHLDEKQPTTTLKWSARLHGNTQLCSVIQC